MNLKKQKKYVVFIFDKIKIRQNGLSDKIFDNANDHSQKDTTVMNF